MPWRPKITTLILGELGEGVSHPPRSYEEKTREQTRAMTTTENEKINIKYCVCSLSLPSHHISFFFVLLKRSTFFIRDLSLLNDYKTVWLWINFYIREPKLLFSVFVTFPSFHLGGGYHEAWQTLKALYYTYRPVRTVVVQMSTLCRSASRVCRVPWWYDTFIYVSRSWLAKSIKWN